MADAFPQRPDSRDSDGPPRPPTFVQIRPPAAPARVRRRLGVLGVGLALVAVVVWIFHRSSDQPSPPVMAQATPKVTADVSPAAPPSAPVNLDAELERRAIDRAASAPLWTRESLMDRVSPFAPPVSDPAPAVTPPVDAAEATPDGPREVSVRLAKGETIGSVLQKLGVASDAVAEVISALSAHVSLKRLPAGLGMTAQIRTAGDDGAKPILEMLTLHPQGRQAITIGRDAKGNYAVEQRRR